MPSRSTSQSAVSKPLRGHHHGRVEARPLAQRLEVRESMERHGGLADARLAEHEERASRVGHHGASLRLVELNLDGRRRAQSQREIPRAEREFVVGRGAPHVAFTMESRALVGDLGERALRVQREEVALAHGAFERASLGLDLVVAIDGAREERSGERRGAPLKHGDAVSHVRVPPEEVVAEPPRALDAEPRETGRRRRRGEQLASAFEEPRYVRDERALTIVERGCGHP